MFRIEFDQSRNLIVIRYRNDVGPEETERALAGVRRVLDDVEPGFRLLVDLTDLRSMDILCAPHIESVMEILNGKGVSKVVRVIPDPKLDIGMQIMSHFHYGGAVEIITCKSAEEAMHFLAE
jgi:hypothetical protein